jgi:hypothetical protein
MLKRYNVSRSSVGRAVLPFLYADRLAHGVVKVLTGRK